MLKDHIRRSIHKQMYIDHLYAAKLKQKKYTPKNYRRSIWLICIDKFYCFNKRASFVFGELTH